MKVLLNNDKMLLDLEKAATASKGSSSPGVEGRRGCLAWPGDAVAVPI
jgi:hypothetical protein